MIRLENISKVYGQLNVLRAIDVEFPQNSVTGIIGPNGSGKTTVIKSILGLIRPNEGKIFYNSIEIDGSKYRQGISYLPQTVQFPKNLTVIELIRMLVDIRKDAPRREELIDLLDIEPFLMKKFGALSGGMKQKVNILAALMYDTETIILDEPTTGLDPMTQIKLKEFLKKERDRGKCILITTHILSLLDELCDRILFLLDGRVCYHDTIPKLKADTNTSGVEAAIPLLMENIPYQSHNRVKT